MIFVLLCGTVLAGCATAHPDVAKLTGGDTQAGHAKKEASAIDKTTPTDLEGGVRQAQAMRLAGHYDEAIRVLSQLMMVAADDPRVVSEYGKTLAQKGRAQDAVEFLNRGIELAANDWTLYSALGVSYDQLGNQVSARTAYEHALALRPEEPSVLNNYALSRMLAGDTEGARILIGRSERAGGAGDAKIASNIALLNKIDPAPVMPSVAPQAVALAAKPAPMPAAMPARQMAPVASAPPAAIPRPQPMRAPVAQNAPRPIMPMQQPAPQQQQRVALALGVHADVINLSSVGSDLVAQESTVTTADMTNVFSALSAMLYPYPTAPAQITISSITDNNSGASAGAANPTGTVAWSCTQGGTARSGTYSFPTSAQGVITRGSGDSVIMTEVSYSYTLPVTIRLPGIINLSGPYAMSSTFYSKPRRVTTIPAPTCP
jgi:hypothetical protein